MKKLIFLILAALSFASAQTTVNYRLIYVDSLKSFTGKTSLDSIRIKSRVRAYNPFQFDSLVRFQVNFAVPDGSSYDSSRLNYIDKAQSISATKTHTAYQVFQDSVVLGKAGDNSGRLIFIDADNGYRSTFTAFGFTASRTHYIPDSSGTYALKEYTFGLSDTSLLMTLYSPQIVTAPKWYTARQYYTSQAVDSLLSKSPNQPIRSVGRHAVDSGFTVMGRSPILDAISTTTEIADTINTSTYDAFGIIGQLPTGKLYVSYRQSTSHSGGDGKIMFRTSEDGGGTWSDSTILWSETGVDLRNVSGGTTPSGRIVLFWLRRLSGAFTPMGMRYSYSDNGGLTWSSPDTIEYTSLDTSEMSPYGKLIEIGDGKLMMSWYGSNYTSAWSAYAIFSTDNGETWGGRTIISQDTIIRASEAATAYLGGGNIVAVARMESPNQHYYQFISTDNGDTWSAQDSLLFDSWTSASAPWLSTSYSPSGNRNIRLYYVNRGDGGLKTIIGTAEELVSGTSGWRNSTFKTILTTNPSGSAYPSVIHPSGKDFGYGWFYDQNSSSDADITFFADINAAAQTVEVYDSVVVGTTQIRRGFGNNAESPTATRIAFYPRETGNTSFLEIVPHGDNSIASILSLYTTDRFNDTTNYLSMSIVTDTTGMWITTSSNGDKTQDHNVVLGNSIGTLSGSGNLYLGSLYTGTTLRINSSGNYTGGSFNGTTVTGSGTFSTTGNTFHIDATSGSAQFIADRSANTFNSELALRTAGSNNWLVAMRGTGDNNFRLYNYGLGNDALVINYTSGNASLIADLTVSGDSINATGASYFGRTISGTGRITTDSSFAINERSTTPTLPTSNTQMLTYMKGDKIIWVINAGGTPRYYYFDATATADQQIKYSATEP